MKKLSVHQREREIEEACGHVARRRGYGWLKMMGMIGIPDRLLILPNCKVLWIEVKTKMGRVSRIQMTVHKALVNWGHRVEIIRSIEEFEELLDECEPNPRRDYGESGIRATREDPR